MIGQLVAMGDMAEQKKRSAAEPGSIINISSTCGVCGCQHGFGGVEIDVKALHVATRSVSESEDHPDRLTDRV